MVEDTSLDSLGPRVDWYVGEEAPYSVLGYLAIGDDFYAFYPTRGGGPLNISFYDEGAQELAHHIAGHYGCEVLVRDVKGVMLSPFPSSWIPNIRLICYPKKNSLEVLYGIGLEDSSYLPKEQREELAQVLRSRGISLPDFLIQDSTMFFERGQ